MSQMEEAIRLYYRGEIFEAEKIIKSILQEEPDNTNALARFAAVQMELGRVEEAGETYLRLAELYGKEGNWEDCLEFLEKVPEGFSREKLSLLRGKCLFRLGRYAEALSDFIVSPGNNEALFYTGKTYFALNQYNNALRTFRGILSGACDTVEMFQACYWVGKALYALGEMEEALSCFKSYISLYPNEAQVYLDLAICYLNSGRLEEARSNLLQYGHLGGSEETVYFYLGIINYHLGNYRETIDLLDKATSSDQTMHWKGLALYELGHYEDALQCFTGAAEYDTKALYLKMMGNSHLKIGSFFEAKMCYEKALSMDPSDKDLEKLVAISRHFLKTEETPK